MTDDKQGDLRKAVKAAFIGRMEVDDWQEKWRLDCASLLAEIDELRACYQSREKAIDDMEQAMLAAERKRDQARAEVERLREELAQRVEPLRWVRFPPVVDGWYWWRDTHRQSTAIARVSGGMVTGILSGTVQANQIDAIEWAGPITPPADEIGECHD